jgi:hypothetical protein
MSGFLKQVFLFSLMVTAILSLLAYTVDKGLQKSDFNNFSEWNAIHQGNINADLIIAGSSRAWVHVSPLILDTALHLSSYNLGFDSYNFKGQQMRYKFYEKFNRNPKFILHCLDIDMLTTKKQLYMTEQFAPYLTDSIIHHGTKAYEGYSALDYATPFTKYQYRTQHIAVGLLEYFNLRHFKTGKYKGYEGMNLPWDGRFEQVKKQNPNGLTIELDEEQVTLFDSYLRTCKRKGITVMLLYPPEYIKGQQLVNNRQAIINLYQKLAKKHGIPFLDYSTNELCYQRNYFYNTQHLNRKGAELFSIQLAADLKILTGKSFSSILPIHYQKFISSGTKTYGN